MKELLPTRELILFDPKTVDPAHGEEIWQKIVDSQDACFDDFSRGRADVMVARWTSPQTLTYEYGDAGLVMVEHIVPRLSADIHFFLWDLAIGDKEIVQVGREVIRRTVETYKLHRVSTMVPAFNQSANRIATRIGFRYEGTVRQTWLYKGKYLDVALHGLLVHEADWIRQSRRDAH